jgi:hypothetical protein
MKEIHVELCSLSMWSLRSEINAMSGKSIEAFRGIQHDL